MGPSWAWSATTSSVAVLTLALALGTPAQAAAASSGGASRDAGALVLVLDASGSMLDPGSSGRRKIDEAKAALTMIVEELPRETPTGLRVFGSGIATRASTQTCRDSRLVVPVSRVAPDELRKAVRSVRARGWTPIAYALNAAAKDLAPRRRGSVVLVSDGVDECYPRFGDEPCEVARRLAGSTVELTVHTIGFTVDDRARQQLRCMARATGGRYWDADDVDDLLAALRASTAPEPLPDPGPPPPRNAGPVLTAAGVALLAAAVALAGVRAARNRRARRYW